MISAKDIPPPLESDVRPGAVRVDAPDPEAVRAILRLRNGANSTRRSATTPGNNESVPVHTSNEAPQQQSNSSRDTTEDTNQSQRVLTAVVSDAVTVTPSELLEDVQQRILETIPRVDVLPSVDRKLDRRNTCDSSRRRPILFCLGVVTLIGLTGTAFALFVPRSGSDSTASIQDQVLDILVKAVATLDTVGRSATNQKSIFALGDYSSLQYEAYTWVLDNVLASNLSNVSEVAEWIVSNYALYLLYLHTAESPIWNDDNSTQWLADSDMDFCRLYPSSYNPRGRTGIIVDDITVCNDKGQLVGMFLDRVGLVAYRDARMSTAAVGIPREIGLLTSLNYLTMFQNSLAGSIPETLTLLTDLKLFEVSFNNLSGTIPSNIGAMKSLEDFRIFHNELISGPVPSGISELPSLQRLEIHQTRLEGQIPDEVCKSLENPASYLVVSCNLVDCGCCEYSGLVGEGAICFNAYFP